MRHRGAHVAGVAISLALAEGSFTRPELLDRLEGAPSQHTVTWVLEQLEADGWLEHDVREAVWRAGSQAQSYRGE
jgi:hypothetical protein